MLTALSLPKTQLSLSKKGNQIFVQCVLRKKKLVLTPEEWVRQHWIQFLVQHLNISAGKIVSEIGLQYGSLNKRADLVVLNTLGEPDVIIECKAPEIPINQNTFLQWSNYQKVYNARIGVLSNGKDHYLIDLIHLEVRHTDNWQEFTSFFKTVFSEQI